MMGPVIIIINKAKVVCRGLYDYKKRIDSSNANNVAQHMLFRYDFKNLLSYCCIPYLKAFRVSWLDN